MLRVPRKRRPPDGDVTPLSPHMRITQPTQTNWCTISKNSEAWTQSLVIDFWRSAPVTLTPGTLQEYDLVLRKCLGENINLVLDSEAWTQSLVIHFWRSAPVTLTPGTLQEYDLVLKKCLEENIHFELDSGGWTRTLLHDKISKKIHFHGNTTYNYAQILPQRRL